MAWSKTYTFSPSTTISSAQVNQNFDDAINAVNQAMPSGFIGIFSGAIASIPTGFYLCNGSNSTPDLRDKFVVGAGSTYAVGATGGAATHTLTAAEMPAHTHTVTGNTTGGSGGVRIDASDSFTETTSSAGSGSAHNNLPPYYALAYIMKS